MRSTPALLLALVAAAPAVAADLPAVELRVRAAADLADAFDHAARLFPTDERVQQYAKVGKAFAAAKGSFLGLDPARPFGAYVGVAAEVDDSPMVAMIPIASEADFLRFLKAFAGLDPRKLDGGLYSFALPAVPAGPGYFRFAHGYAYVTIRSAKSIAADRVPAPKDFFAAQPPDAVTATVRIDRFAADIRGAILGQLELGWHETITALGGTPVEQAIRRLLVDLGADALKTVLEEGLSIDFAANLDPKADEFAATVKLTPRGGTGLAKFLKVHAARDSRAASMFAVTGDGTASITAANIVVPERSRKAIQAAVQGLIVPPVDTVSDEAREKKKAFYDMLAPTLAAGHLEFSARIDPTTTLFAGDSDIRLGLRVAERAPIRPLLNWLQDYGGGEFRVLGVQDRKSLTIYDFRYRERTETPPTFPGIKPPDVVTDDGVWTAGYRQSSLLDGLKREAKPMPMFRQDLYVSRLDGMADRAKAAYGGPVPFGADRIRLVVEGGDALTVAFTAKGKALALLTPPAEAKPTPAAERTR